MTIKRRTVLLAGVVLTGFAAAGAQNRDMPGRAAAAIAASLHLPGASTVPVRHLQLLPPDLQLPDTTELGVRSVRRGADAGTWIFRLQCVPSVKCLPFHAVLRGDAELQKRLLENAGRETSALSPAAPNAASGFRPRKPGGPLLIRTGEHIHLREESSGVRLTVPAVSLEPGGLGDTVRVRNLATRRILNARISAPGWVWVEE